MIHIRARKLRVTVLSMLSIFAVGMIVSTAQASDADWLAHRAVSAKLRREAGDRFNIRFLTTHIDRLQNGKRHVTGKGVFSRKGKTGQNFTYHTTVNINDNSDRLTGYEIR